MKTIVLHRACQTFKAHNFFSYLDVFYSALMPRVNFETPAMHCCTARAKIPGTDQRSKPSQLRQLRQLRLHPEPGSFTAENWRKRERFLPKHGTMIFESAQSTIDIHRYP